MDVEYRARMEIQYREAVDLPARLRAGAYRREAQAQDAEQVSKPRRRGLIQWVAAHVRHAGAPAHSLPAASTRA